MKTHLSLRGRISLGVLLCFMALLSLGVIPLQAQEPNDLPPSLKTVRVSFVGQVKRFVQDEQTAVELGKTLFWDMQVGSDGIQACASCHFHGGADNRTKNQLSPGSPSLGFTPFDFGGPNFEVTEMDFPFPKTRDEVMSSQGVFLRWFDSIVLGVAEEESTLADDPVFSVLKWDTLDVYLNVRRVEPRNSPTVINAIFNHRNFWDGRASNVFNAGDPFGPGTSQRVFTVHRRGVVRERVVNLNFASTASQAVGPPLSDLEMSFMGRSFRDLGKKMLSLKPLEKQDVHPEDSVLGWLADTVAGKGLTVSYEDMIKRTFHREYWDSNKIVKYNPDGTAMILDHPGRPLHLDEFTIMEANFPFFFGLAVLFYEATLVSDETPYDRFVDRRNPDPNALTAQQKQGLELFLGKGKCIACHSGAEFTNASVSNAGKEPIEFMEMADGRQVFYDTGFYNIGVRATAEDIGIGGFDPYGRPLSLAKRKYGEDGVAVDGAFKTPTLRNVELTGPYFHTGGFSTLKQVMRFYNLGARHPMGFAEENIRNLHPDIQRLFLTIPEEDALVAFMLALTDPRVKWTRAPFDHPQLWVLNGHPGDHTRVFEDSGYPGQATDTLLEIPAVGRNGLGAPLQTFLYLSPFAE